MIFSPIKSRLVSILINLRRIRENYQMYMTYNGGAEQIRFPVLPDIINVKQGMNNQSVNIQGLGELVIMQDPSAVIISFSSYFPVQAFPGVQFTNLESPINLIEKISNWKKADRPVQFMITGTNINGYFTIEHFQWHEAGGDPGTIQYSVVLKEYKETSVRQVNIEAQNGIGGNNGVNIAIIPEPVPARVDNRTPVRTHTVVKGDTLTRIARQHFGGCSRWREIYTLNSDIISNPNLIFPGQVLRLPI